MQFVFLHSFGIIPLCRSFHRKDSLQFVQIESSLLQIQMQKQCIPNRYTNSAMDINKCGINNSFILFKKQKTKNKTISKYKNVGIQNGFPYTHIYIILLQTVDHKTKVSSACFILENPQGDASIQLERRCAKPPTVLAEP
ncbi:unnamed protein product [Pipistrellus nathusii]|uniref:Uncharacterized protein n=1 Tax=Pipistrellus nathusii TaxID=59473 RepID=A0ABN9Z1H0_PIPNA